MPPWDLTGNAGTTDANFLGTRDRRPLVIKTNNSEAMRIEPNGKVGIGTKGPNAPLQIGSDTYTQDSKIILDAGNGAQRRAWSMGVPYGDTTVTSPNARSHSDMLEKVWKVSIRRLPCQRPLLGLLYGLIVNNHHQNLGRLAGRNLGVDTALLFLLKPLDNGVELVGWNVVRVDRGHW